MWDDFYGPMSPMEIVCNLRPAMRDLASLDLDNLVVPPELERVVGALLRLHRNVKTTTAQHDAG